MKLKPYLKKISAILLSCSTLTVLAYPCPSLKALKHAELNIYFDNSNYNTNTVYEDGYINTDPQLYTSNKISLGTTYRPKPYIAFDVTRTIRRTLKARLNETPINNKDCYYLTQANTLYRLRAS